jgi:hypothetical protein
LVLSKNWYIITFTFSDIQAFSSSSGSKVGISEKVMVDILWSLWKTLVEVIRAALGAELEAKQLKSLAETVATVREPLLALWIETSEKSKGGRAREGRLVEVRISNLISKLTDF